MKNLFFVIIISCLAFVSGCVPKTSQESTLLLQIKGYESQLKDQPNNPSLLQEIGQRYGHLYEITNARHYRKQSIDYLERYTAIDSENPEVQLNLYYSLYSKAADTGKAADYSRLSELFNSMSLTTKKQTNPPALAEFFSRTKRKDYETSVSLLKRAITEQPYATYPYIYLSGMYMGKNHETLSLSVLKHGVNVNPSNNVLSAMLGYRYLKKGKSTICQGQHRPSIQKSIGLYSKLVKNEPKNAKYRLHLADAYSYLGKERLALIHYKASIEHQPSKEAYWGTGYSYILMGQLDKAGKAFDNAMKFDRTTNRDLGDLAFIQGDYFKAKEIYKKVNRAYPGDTYTNLKYYLAADLSSKVSNSYLRYLDNMTDWEKTLYDYYNGQLDETALMDSAKDACKLTEAYFLQAIVSKQRNDEKKYMDYLEKVVETEVYPYAEYVMAKGILNKK